VGPFSRTNQRAVRSLKIEIKEGSRQVLQAGAEKKRRRRKRDRDKKKA